MTRYVAAIDQGTSSSRCILFDRAGDVAASAQREHAQVHPRAGWVEHDPLEIVGERARGGRRGGRGRRARPPPTSRPSGSRTSARRPCCGTARPASRCTTRSCGRTCAPRRWWRELRGRRRRGPPARDDRPPPLHLLLRPEGALAARRAARAAGARRGRRAAASGRSTRAAVAPDGRRRPRDRRDERQPHAA